MNRNRRWTRRGFLRGAGTLIALPWLESVSRAKTTPTAPVRTVVFFVPNGMQMARWRPEGDSGPLVLPAHLNSLAEHRDQLTLLTGLTNSAGWKTEGEPHSNCTGAILTARPVPGEGEKPSADFVSFDQVIAGEIGGLSRFPSLVLGSEGALTPCVGSLCFYAWNVSWNGTAGPSYTDLEPLSVFERLFAGVDPGLTEHEKKKRRVYKQSVLDTVIEDAESLHKKLGATDRHRLDAYLTGIFEIESRLTESGGQACLETSGAGTALSANPANIDEHVRQMCDVMALALQCDQTRVISYMLATGGSDRNYPELGVYDSHHELSHHKQDQTKIDKLISIEKWELGRFAKFLDTLAAVNEGDGTLLDHSQVLFLSPMGDGDAHTPTDLPVLLAGSAGGRIATGRHLVYKDEPPIGGLYLSLMENAGVYSTAFGSDGTTPLPSLAG